MNNQQRIHADLLTALTQMGGVSTFAAELIAQYMTLTRQADVLRQDLYQLNADMMGPKEWDHSADRRKHEINIAWAEHKADRMLQ